MKLGLGDSDGLDRQGADRSGQEEIVLLIDTLGCRLGFSRLLRRHVILLVLKSNPGTFGKGDLLGVRYRHSTDSFSIDLWTFMGQFALLVITGTCRTSGRSSGYSN